MFLAYQSILQNKLTFNNLQKAHAILSANLLPKSQQGAIRTNPMFVINSDDRIEYTAAEPSKLKSELEKLFEDIKFLQAAGIDDFFIFLFRRLHPFSFCEDPSISRWQHPVCKVIRKMVPN